MKFFERFISGLKRTRGMKFIIGIALGSLVSPLGFVLAVLDP